MEEPNLGAIAQLGERYNGIVEVSGSIPLSSTISLLKITPQQCADKKHKLSHFKKIALDKYRRRL